MRSRVVLAGVVVLVASAAGAAAYAIPNLYGGKDSTCFWAVGAINGGTLNIAYPDAGANYWAAVYTVPAGATLELKGEYPRARYASVESYNALGVVTDALVDYQINPDSGSRNPFRAGVQRDVKPRSFTITLRDSSPASPLSPDQRSGEAARNYLYTKPVGRYDGASYSPVARLRSRQRDGSARRGPAASPGAAACQRHRADRQAGM